MASAVLQVFGQPASTDVARVMACLFERKLEFELVRVDAFKRAHKLPSNFVKMRDPSGQVTLKHGDITLTDSRDICRYVCTEFPRQCTRNLFGAGALERASIEKWLQAEAQSFDAPSSALAFHLALAPPMGGASPAAPDADDEEVSLRAGTAESERQLLRVLDVYDDALGRSAYLAGDEFTLADLSHLPNTHYIACSARGRALLASRENVARWYEAISARPAWRQVVRVQCQSAHCPVPFEL
ncbi:glutathione S-transferase F11-like [Phragmites australis]|uniref:glutathione S-transferase F11-like n=1 Tax=Phragmites australis TaxID=29695 RepID=UPI002D7938FF|nr:glutathione S-transferase F11-like [Phragmites australis]